MRTKHYGDKNADGLRLLLERVPLFAERLRLKGFQKAALNRSLNAIHRRYNAGERPQTSKALAKILDRLYGTDYVNQFHGSKT